MAESFEIGSLDQTETAKTRLMLLRANRENISANISQGEQNCTYLLQIKQYYHRPPDQRRATDAK